MTEDVTASDHGVERSDHGVERSDPMVAAMLGEIDRKGKDTAWALRCLADVMEEAGDHRAAGVRWVVDSGKLPLNVRGGKPRSGIWGWYTDLPERGNGDHPHVIEHRLFEAMEGYDDSGFAGRLYATLSEAYLRLAEAYVKTRGVR